MFIWSTTIRAIDPTDGELKTFCGPNISALTRQMAHDYCQRNGLGYCEVGDRIIAEIPTKDGLTADWDMAINYENNN